jgi:predicted peroxiredoxin
MSDISIFFFTKIFLLQQKEADLIIEHQKHSDTQSLLMKHAIANSVKLCVVAPTVHVHIADEEHKLQSG